MQQRGQHIAHQQGDHGQHCHPLEHNLQRFPAKAYLTIGLAECGKTDHDKHHHDILDNQKADRDAAVQGINLALVGEQLDDNDGAGKSQRYRNIDSRHVRQTEQQGKQVPYNRGKDNLTETRSECYRPDCSNDMQVQFQADHKQQQGDAEAGEQLDLAALGNQFQPGRADQNANRNEGDDQRLAQQLRQGAAENRQPQQNADLYENIPVHALLPDSLTRAADAALNSVQANRSDDAVADQYTRRRAGND